MHSAAELNAQARTLDASARAHKRQEKEHRRAAQDARRQLDALIAFSRKLGIPIEMAERKAQP